MNASGLPAAALLAALSSCAAFGGGRTLNRGPELATGEGEVVFKKDGGGGTSVELRVRHLPEPEGLEPPGYAYVAWVRHHPEAAPLNLGALSRRDEAGAELKARTELDFYELFITAEAAVDAERPTGRRLLWAERD
ncbi:MAG: hypothetical protein Q8T11_10595 [Elusimicrobiota bacterium]|nr:hypothetical protein [Elusimicrobiota bacterium]